METIYDAGRRVFESARWDTLQVGNTDDCIEMFEDGVEFAQKWNLIERDQYAKIDLNQREELEYNMPILVKYFDKYNDIAYDVFAEYCSILEDPLYTHWRPIELK